MFCNWTTVSNFNYRIDDFTYSDHILTLRFRFCIAISPIEIQATPLRKLPVLLQNIDSFVNNKAICSFLPSQQQNSTASPKGTQFDKQDISFDGLRFDRAWGLTNGKMFSLFAKFNMQLRNQFILHAAFMCGKKITVAYISI